MIYIPQTPSMTSLEMTRIGIEGESSTPDKVCAVNEETRRHVFSLPATGQPILQRQNRWAFFKHNLGLIFYYILEHILFTTCV